MTSSESRPIIAVASVLADKDWSSMVAELKSQIDYWHIAELTGISVGQSLLKLLYNSGIEGALAIVLCRHFNRQSLRPVILGK